MTAKRSKYERKGEKRVPGRPRLPETQHELNGRKSRRMNATMRRDEYEKATTMSVAMNARVRHFTRRLRAGKVAEFLADPKARNDPRLGYELGRLRLLGYISASQHDAGVRYAQDMARYYGLSGVAFPSARAQSLFSVASDSEDSDKRIKAASDARVIKKALERLLLGVSDIDTGRRVDTTIKTVCLVDSIAAGDREMVWLVRGLNALAKHYKLDA